jgi:UDP-glucose:(heptosyl)LPS alpha-1,3-glucosyltransferase
MNEKAASGQVKVAVVIPKYGLVGGAEGYAAELTEQMAKNPRYAMHVFANRWQKESDKIQFHKVPILSFPKFLTTPSFAWLAGKRIKDGGFDLIHSHERIFHADLATLHSVPHRFWVRQIRNKRPNFYDVATIQVEKIMMADPRCHWYLPVSELAKTIHLQEYPLDPTRVCVIHPGVHIEPFASPNGVESRHETRRLLSIGKEDLVMLFVSMNFELKGLDDLLEGMAALHAQGAGKTWSLLVVGKGNKAKYRALARKIGLENKIFFAGVVPKQQLVSMYLASDAFAMLSRFDTFGMAALEAMATGIPVMVSANVGAKDIVRTGENGFVIEHTSDRNAVADCLVKLLDPALRSVMRQAALETARNNSWEAAAAKMETLYEEVLRSKSGSA